MIHVTDVKYSFITSGKRANGLIDPHDLLRFAVGSNVSNRFKLPNGDESEHLFGMNCRPFAVIAFALGGLVPTIVFASPGSPTHRSATARATILSPISTQELARKGASGKYRKDHVYGNVLRRFIDDNGLVTKFGNPRSYKIIIVDLP
jgi:hypothetical protein